MIVKIDSAKKIVIPTKIKQQKQQQQQQKHQPSDENDDSTNTSRTKQTTINLTMKFGDLKNYRSDKNNKNQDTTTAM